MFKLNVLFTLFVVGLVSSVSATTPPACVLACVNEEKMPADVEAVCAASAAQECLYTACASEEYNDAVDYFNNICKSNNHKIADAYKPSGTASHAPSKPTGTGSSASGSASKPTSTSSGGASESSAPANSAGKLNGIAAPVYALAGAAMAFYAFA